ncbi:N-6 DNA methylase [Streptomyces sp. NPDC056835]|uniref:N-6 DNA methylase n=1 Tax=Streptomyces sp. NPDC056835 TaxID=3345956 RepID=UPI0036B43052
MTSPPAVPVTLAEIARLAGVGRAAVSNWRRRHDTFPPRIGGTDVSPHFSLTDIEKWLRENRKLGKVTSREWLWPRFEALGDRDETGLAIAAAGRLLARGESGGGPDDAGSGPVRAAVELGRREGSSDILMFLLRRWLDTHVRQITTTPEPLADLMADLALRVRESAAGEQREDPVTVLDPACGAGHLLAAAATAVPAALNRPAALLGCDRDPVLTALTDVRLALLPRPGAPAPAPVVAPGDSLRADPLIGTQADMVLCNPPSNERDWGYEDLATDARWAHGMPPRTEPELAWVQHCLARLRPGGSAVLLLPPTVAARKAGRRIRGSLLRTGALRAVVALPPGSAAPHSVSLHLWVLRRPVAGESPPGPGELLLVDAAARFPRSAARENGPEWGELGAFVRSVVTGAIGGGTVGGARGGLAAEDPDTTAWATVIPVVDLLDDEVDLTPGRHITSASGHAGPRLADSWNEVGELLDGLRTESAGLAALDLSSGTADQPNATVGELARAGALTLRSGRHPAEAATLEPRHARIPLLTLSDLLLDGSPRGWAHPDDAVVVESGDVVVVGVSREFSAWVHEGPPMAVGPQIHAIRVDPEVLDRWFLAGSLTASANARHAGTHASSSSRIDMRRLQVRRLALPEQQRYSDAFRHLAAFERLAERLGTVAKELGRDLGDELAAGRLVYGK